MPLLTRNLAASFNELKFRIGHFVSLLIITTGLLVFSLEIWPPERNLPTYLTAIRTLSVDMLSFFATSVAFFNSKYVLRIKS